MRTLIKKAPIISSVVISIFFMVIAKLIGRAWVFGDGAVSLFLYEFVQMLLPFLLVLLCSDADVYKKGSMLKTFAAGGYLLVGQLLLLFIMFTETFFSEGTIWQTPVGIMFGIVSLFGIGFREESIFRGIVVNNIAKKYLGNRKGVYVTVLTSGFLFGAMHLSNLVLGVNPFSVVIQSVVAMASGFYLAAIYLRGGSLWALIIMHTLVDSASMFKASFTTNNGTMADAIGELSLSNLTPFFVLSLLTLFLLRKEKCDEIIERYKTAE